MDSDEQARFLVSPLRGILVAVRVDSVPDRFKFVGCDSKALEDVLGKVWCRVQRSEMLPTLGSGEGGLGSTDTHSPSMLEYLQSVDSPVCTANCD